MEDVHPGTGLPRTVDHAGDGGPLGLDGSGVEEVLVPDPQCVVVDEVVRVLGVDDEERVECGDLGDRGTQLRRVEVRELVDAGRRGEALETEDPGGVQVGEGTRVVGDRSAPEPDVDRDASGGAARA